MNTIFRNRVLHREGKRPIVYDAGFKASQTNKPLVIFLHGFKGFKDWGLFNTLMEKCIESDFCFVKFNFSHNGGTVDNPIDFPDPEAFGQNNYLLELDDIHDMVQYITSGELFPENEADYHQLYLVAHSRGGAMAIVYASENRSIKKLVTWAAVSDVVKRLPVDCSSWKKEGVIYIENTRTKQQLPMYWSFAETTLQHANRLDIGACESRLRIPHLIVHGNCDEAVLVEEALHLKERNAHAELCIFEGANHTFGVSHPFTSKDIPQHFTAVCDKTIQFLQEA